MNKNLKLFMENFDPTKGIVSYVVENEVGDRIARSECTREDLKNYSPSTMDFFILGFLPKLVEMDAQMQVQGPISQYLHNMLEDVYPALVKASQVVEGSNREYKTIDIDLFDGVFLSTKDLNGTLDKVFNYYK